MADQDEYDDRRDFRRTPEPAGDGGLPAHLPRPIFVVQQHDASSEHYDLRLEVDGGLASWAVPKGPSTDPSEKRLALRTEEHPLAYANFEGVIPEDEYGAGPVLIWDRGRFRNLLEEKDEPVGMAEALQDGHVEVWLDGEKLRGGYALVRTGEEDGQERWLLVKMDDDEADARRRPTSTEPRSVASGRTIDEVAEGGGEA